MWNNHHHPSSRPQIGATYPTSYQLPPHPNSYPNAHYPPRFRHDSPPGPTDWARLAQNWMAQRTTATPESNYPVDSSIRHGYPDNQTPHGASFIDHGHGQHSHSITNFSASHPSSFNQRSPRAPITASVFSPGALHGPSRAPPYFRPNYHPSTNQHPYYPQQNENMHGVTHFPPDPPANMPAVKSDDVASHLSTSSLPNYPPTFPQENIIGEYNGATPSLPSHSSVQYGTFVPQAPVVGHFNPISGSHGVTNVDSVPIVFDHEHGNAAGYPIPIKPNEIEVMPPSLPVLDYNLLQPKDYPTTAGQPGGGRRLPSWLRAELEKIETKKRQEQLSKTSPDSDANEDVDDDNLNDSHGVVMRDAHESEDQEHSEPASSPRRLRSLSPDSQSAHSPTPSLKHLSEEERMEEEMLFIRITLTELLLETTKELLYDAARSAYKAARSDAESIASHGSEHRMLAYNASKSIQNETASDDGNGNESRLGGLVAYGSDDSDSEAENEGGIVNNQHKSPSPPIPEYEHTEIFASKSGIKDEETAQMDDSNSFVIKGRGGDRFSQQHRYSEERRSSSITKVSPDDKSSYYAKYSKNLSPPEKREDPEAFSHRSATVVKRKHEHKSRDPQDQYGRSKSPERLSKRKKKHKHHSSSDSYSEVHNHSNQRSRERGSSKRSDKSKHRKKQKKIKSHRHRSSSRSTSRSSHSRRHDRHSKRNRS